MVRHIYGAESTSGVERSDEKKISGDNMIDLELKATMLAGSIYHDIW